MQLARNIFPRRSAARRRSPASSRRRVAVEMKQLPQGHDPPAVPEPDQPRGGAHGVEAAAQIYFGKHAQQLNVAEGGHARGAPQAAGVLQPSRTPPGARRAPAQRGAGGLMRDQGFLNAGGGRAVAGVPARAHWKPHQLRRRRPLLRGVAAGAARCPLRAGPVRGWSAHLHDPRPRHAGGGGARAAVSARRHRSRCVLERQVPGQDDLPRNTSSRPKVGGEDHGQFSPAISRARWSRSRRTPGTSAP